MRRIPLFFAAAALAAVLPAQNTNQDAPRAVHNVVWPNGTSLTVSYNQLTLAQGKSLEALMTKGERGAGMRAFYNDRYLPGTLAGKIEVSVPITLADHELAAGTYGFTFRIDEDLVWHLIVNDAKDKPVAKVALKTDQKAAKAERLVVQPIPTTPRKAEGKLEIRYGPLSTYLPFGAPADKKPTSKPAQRRAG